MARQYIQVGNGKACKLWVIIRKEIHDPYECQDGPQKILEAVALEKEQCQHMEGQKQELFQSFEIVRDQDAFHMQESETV